MNAQSEISLSTLYGFNSIKHIVCTSEPEIVTKQYSTGSQEYFSWFIFLFTDLLAYVFNILVAPLLSDPAHREEGPERNGNPCIWWARSEEHWITHGWITCHLSSLLDYWAQPYQGRHSCLHIGNYLAWIIDMAFSGVLLHTFRWY